MATRNRLTASTVAEGSSASARCQQPFRRMRPARQRLLIYLLVMYLLAENRKHCSGSYSVSYWRRLLSIALLIQIGGASWWPQASRARRQPRSFGRFLVATPLKRGRHCLRRLW
jgi:hypothetical protein